MASENLLENPGFENASASTIGDWSQYAYGTKGGRLTVVNDAAAAHSGAKCVKFETTSGNISVMQAVGAPWQRIVFPGKRQRYLARVWAKGENCHLVIDCPVYGKDLVLPKDFQRRFTFPVTGEWKEYTAAITMPEGVTHLNLILGIKGGEKGPLFVDDAGLYDAREAQVRFLPSRESLVATVDATFLRWEKELPPGSRISAEVEVHAKGANSTSPLLKGQLTDLDNDHGVWRASTKALREGEYTVQVRLKDQAGRELGREEDWFEKRVFDWMVNQRGFGEDVPSPYTPLEVKEQEVRPWGRSYQFDKLGLPERMVSQGKLLLNRKMELTGVADGRPLAWEVQEPFRFTQEAPREARGQAAFRSGNLLLKLESATEYDGFLRLRLTYGPDRGGVTISQLRLRAPLAAAYCKFYSADGAPWQWNPADKEGGYNCDLLPVAPGRAFDSLSHQQTRKLPVTFTGLFWVGDYETCFCYASDGAAGWLLRDDQPSVEAFREGKDLLLCLNLVDRESTLTSPRTLEFAFQAGPLKPLPEGWRGIQYGGDPDDAPLTFSLAPGSGSGYTLAGATHFIHPGNSEEQRRKSKEKIEQAIAVGRKAVGGYHFWGYVPKGFPETRVFRSEWGIDKETWESETTPREWEWKNRFFGEDKDLCIILRVDPVPSYVDFTIYAYDEALKHTALSGFYDDTGYPKPVFDEELGLGYRREDGVKSYSSGVWIYRDRWKRAAQVNHKYHRPNFLLDSQHVRAHYLPAYGAIGIWAPCEHGYYNPFGDRDILDFYGSIERYVAFNPARQFGQIPMVGMSAGHRKDNAAVFAQDTRCMMLLALLNDQDVGSFGARDERVVCKLRRARNVFKPWEPDVSFIGYWANKEWLKCEQAGVLASLYHRRDGALFIVGNVGEERVTASVEPDWTKLGLNPNRLTAVNAESGEPLAWTGAATGRGFTVQVPRHDVRLVLAGPAGSYPVASATLGAELAKPVGILENLSDRFAGPELSPAWQKDLHPGAAGACILDGRLCIQGNHYGYAHARRELGVDNVSVQCLVLGGSDEWGASLFLYWPNGAYVQAAPAMNQGKFFYVVSNAGRRSGSPVSKRPVPGWYPYCANWVRIGLKPNNIECSGSADGATWVKDWEIARDAMHAGAPQYIMLGNGSPGRESFLNNVHPKYFSPSNTMQSFFSDLVVAVP